MIRATLDRQSAKAIQMTKEWPERTKFLTSSVPYEISRYVHEGVKKGIPGGREWAAYRDSLEVAEARTKAVKGAAIYAVRADVKSRGVTEQNAEDTILYVRAKGGTTWAGNPRGGSGSFKVPTKVYILEKYSPWTWDTLPFVPKRTHAKIISRKVREAEVDKISDSRKRDMPRVRRDLARAGVRSFKGARAGIESIKTAPDVAFEALRLELGVGQKARPHWRPILRTVRSSIRRPSLRKKWVLAITDPGWRLREPSPGLPTVTFTDLKSYRHFQNNFRPGG